MSKLMDSLTEWIRQFRCGKIWINKLVSKETKRVYLSYFKKFCDAVGKNPDELINMKLEGMKNVGTQKEFNIKLPLKEDKNYQTKKLNEIIECLIDMFAEAH